MHIKMNILFTLGSLMGLLAGGVLLKLVSHLVRGKIQFMYAICGGVLLGLLFFDILPSTWHLYDLKGVLLGIVAGYIAMLCIDLFLHKQNSQISPLQALILLTLAIFFHNIITGITFGITDIHQSTSVFVATVLHQIPEGMAIMTVLSLAKVPNLFFLLIIAFLSLSLGGSLLIGESVQASSLKLQALSTGGAIGTLSFVIFHEIIGKAITHFRNLHVWLLISLGVLIIYVYQYSLSLLH
ncbi:MULTISPECIES: hypothetical protein [Priestia]|uniref:hypothetical protein n=1 Tax=Priestia TaxID=2800373 RepID=UPI000762B636|nr:MULTISPECIES: hypothetical protein [Priestia]KWU59974.1 hypothetical protein AWX17_20210 [Priestia megaterium]MCE4093147.1 ZIP family metal transporter [Priestia megaterium]MED3821837.1 hypothetical protein [Priestia aryabhattai]